MDVAEGTVSTKGLTAIPLAIQKALDLKPGDKIIYSINNQHVEMRKKK